MDQTFYRQLRELAYNNVTAHRLVQWWETGAVSYEEWSAKAILLLVEQNDIYRKSAIDSAMNRPCPQLIVLGSTDERAR